MVDPVVGPGFVWGPMSPRGGRGLMHRTGRRRKAASWRRRNGVILRSLTFRSGTSVFDPEGVSLVITFDDVRRFATAFPEVEEFTHFRFGQPVFKIYEYVWRPGPRKSLIGLWVDLAEVSAERVQELVEHAWRNKAPSERCPLTTPKNAVGGGETCRHSGSGSRKRRRHDRRAADGAVVISGVRTRAGTGVRAPAPTAVVAMDWLGRWVNAGGSGALLLLCGDVQLVVTFQLGALVVLRLIGLKLVGVALDVVLPTFLVRMQGGVGEGFFVGFGISLGVWHDSLPCLNRDLDGRAVMRELPRGGGGTPSEPGRVWRRV
jgi:hypothetical protein